MCAGDVCGLAVERLAIGESVSQELLFTILIRIYNM